MDYSFEEVKKYFDKYNIRKNENGEYFVVNIATKIPFNAKDLVDNVKFAHTWFEATRNGRSRPSPDLSEVTEDDYIYAFNNESKKVYDCIMAIVSQTMQARGLLLSCEALVNVIKQAKGLRTHAYDTAKGLYKNERFVEAFDTWVRKANNIPTYEEIQNNGIMDYSFEEVKKYFDKYNIRKNENGEYFVVNKATKIHYDAKHLVDKVKFAYTWFDATRNGRSRTTPDLSEITDDDYLYAFSNGAKEVYDYIMAVVSQTMQASGHLLSCEDLVNVIKQAKSLRKYAYQTAEGLYKNERYFQAFDTWVRKANNIPTYEEIQNNGIKR